MCIRDSARAALKAINRFPVREPIDGGMADGEGANPATARQGEAAALNSAA